LASAAGRSVPRAAAVASATAVGAAAPAASAAAAVAAVAVFRQGHSVTLQVLNNAGFDHKWSR